MGDLVLKTHTLFILISLAGSVWVTAKKTIGIRITENHNCTHLSHDLKS